MIGGTRQLLERLRNNRPDEPSTTSVMRVGECPKTMEIARPFRAAIAAAAKQDGPGSKALLNLRNLPKSRAMGEGRGG